MRNTGSSLLMELMRRVIFSRGFTTLDASISPFIMASTSTTAVRITNMRKVRAAPCS